MIFQTFRGRVTKVDKASRTCDVRIVVEGELSTLPAPTRAAIVATSANVETTAAGTPQAVTVAGVPFTAVFNCADREAAEKRFNASLYVMFPRCLA